MAGMDPAASASSQRAVCGIFAPEGATTYVALSNPQSVDGSRGAQWRQARVACVEINH